MFTRGSGLLITIQVWCLGSTWLFCLHTRTCTFSCPVNCTLRQNYQARGKPVQGPNEVYSHPPGLLSLLHKKYQLCEVDDKSLMQEKTQCCVHSFKIKRWLILPSIGFSACSLTIQRTTIELAGNQFWPLRRTTNFLEASPQDYSNLLLMAISGEGYLLWG